MNRTRKIVTTAVSLFIVLALALVGVAEHFGWVDVFFLFGNPATRKVDIESVGEVHFINCGQGDSVLIVSGGESVLIDAGPKKHGNDVVNYLRKNRIRKLDYIVFSHFDEDHIGGSLKILENFPVGNIFLKTPEEEPTTDIYIKMKTEIKNKKIEKTETNAGDTFKCGEFDFEFIGPTKKFADTNNNSLVVRAKIGEISYLLTGDMEADGEKSLLEGNVDIRASVLKVGHHGSKDSSKADFLQKVNAEYAVISSEKGNSYGHPNNKTIRRLVDALGSTDKIYRTDINGNIVFYNDGKNIEVVLEKERK